MSAYLNFSNEPELLKLRTNNAEIEYLKYQTEKHDHENILKSLKKILNNIKRNKKV